MRNIPPAALAALQQTSGIEPILVVRVFWNKDAPINYCDRKFEAEGLVGKLMTVTGLEDVIDVSSSASSVSMTITLDDSDGEIKQIFDSIDIHKVYVQVLQWIEELPLSEAFIIYEGEISSPIIWTEGVRNLSFDVLSHLEDREVGFSADEAQFSFLPSSLLGVPWPIVFGKVAGVPLLKITEAPSAVLSAGFGIVGNEAWDEELAAIAANLEDLYNQSAAANAASRKADAEASRIGSILGTPDDPDKEAALREQARSYFQQALQYTDDYYKLLTEYNAKVAERTAQKSYQKNVLQITSSNLPQNVPLTIEINNWRATAIVLGNTMTVSNFTQIPDPNIPIGSNQFDFTPSLTTKEYSRVAKQQKFTWFDGGSTIKIFNFPRHYIASVGQVVVLNVWSPSKYSPKTLVPRQYYRVVVENFNGMVVTKIIFDSPLTSQPGEWQDGSITADCVSTMSNNIVEIMAWAIENYSDFPYDSASFSTVRNRVAPFPANFVLNQRKNLVQFLQELAFQARCSIWINDRKFFICFLPEQQVPSNEITEADIAVNSMQVTVTETERLITKFVATWRERADQSEANKVIFRYNVGKYGTIEESYDFYAYNQVEVVSKMAEFWMIRKANTWKKISCGLYLNKLQIEAFDFVNFSFDHPFVANGDVVGMVEKAFFNADNDTISIEAWLPVRLGEMVPYTFAYPFDVQTVYPVLDDPNIITGNPFDQAKGEIVPPSVVLTTASLVSAPYAGSYTWGRGLPMNDGAFQQPRDFVTALDPAEVTQGRPLGLTGFNNFNRYEVKQFATVPNSPLTPNVFFGRVVSKISDTEYTCNVFFKGFGNGSTRQNVLIGFIRAGSTLPDGFPLAVYRTVFYENNAVNYEYWGQPAIWQKIPMESSDI